MSRLTQIWKIPGRNAGEEMPLSPGPSRQRLALKITVIYAILGGAWIFFSDVIAAALFTTPQALTQIGMIKGWLYVLLTALLVYHLVSRGMRETEQSQEALRLSEERFRTMFELASVGLAQADPETGRWQRVNARLCAITGYTAAELLEMRCTDITHPEDRDHDWEAFQQVVHGEVAECRNEERYVRKDGTVVWANVHITLPPSPPGHPRLSLAVIEDISERKRAAAALEAEAMWRRILIDQSRDGIVILDETGKVYEANQRYADMLGYSPEETRELYVWDWDTQWTREQLLEQIRLIDAAGDHFETHHRRKDGTYYDVEISTNGAVWQGRKLVFCVCRDISARKAAEEALREREAQYRAVIETSGDGFLMTDAQGRFLEVNDVYVRRSGYSREELLGMRISDVEARETPQEAEAHFDRIRQKGSDLFESLHRTKDGTIWPVEINAAYWPSAGGRFFAFFRDINQRQRSEALLRTRFHLSDLASRSGLDALMQAAVDAAELFTGSRIGFFHFVDQDQENLTLQAWSTNTSKNMCRAEGKGQHYPISQAGVWMDCFYERAPVIHNDYLTLPHKKGMPAGHPSVSRDLSVPIFRDGLVVAILGVGNKTTDYTQDDVEVVQELASMAWDMVDRKRAEGALRQSEERHRALVETSFDWIWEVDAQGRYTYASPNSANLLGYAPEEMLGRTPFEFMPPEEVPHMEKIIAAIVAEKQPFIDLESAYLHRDGHQLILETRGQPMFGADGQLLGYRGSGRDITETKQAEAVLQERLQLEERLSRLAAAVPGVIFAYRMRPDGYSCFPYASPTIEEIFGLSAANLRDDAIAGFNQVHADDLSQVQASILESAGNLSPWQQEFRVHHPQKGEIWAEGRALPVREPDGGTLWHGFFHDITARKHAEAERFLFEAQMRQAQKMEALGTLAGGIAHDFNNILGIIMGYAEMSEWNTAEASPLRRNIQEIIKASQRAKDLVQQILAFSRRTDQEKMPVQMELTVKEAMKMLRASLPSTVDIKVKVASKAVVLADPTQIHQVLMNLCTNAAYAMREDGGLLEVSLTEVQLTPEDICPHSGLQPGPHVKLMVKDTGKGIPPEVLDRIFDPFFTTKEQGAGTGLGLAVVHGIITSLGGNIEVDSILGQGTIFQVFLPIIDTAPVVVKRQTAALPQGRERILMVDDEAVLAKATKQMLEFLGYEVDYRTSGLEALEAFRLHLRDQPIDLVVTDMTMPNLTGLDLSRELLRLQPDLPIILCTGFSEKVNAENAKSLGIKEFLPKPFGLRELAKVVRRVLDERRQ